MRSTECGKPTSTSDNRLTAAGGQGCITITKAASDPLQGGLKYFTGVLINVLKRSTAFLGSH